MDYYLGEIRMFAGTFAPQDWHFCDGSTLSISTYQALYALLGTVWGGDGVSNFGLPDLRGRVPLGQGAGANLTPRVLAQKGGVEAVALSDASTMPLHNHLVAVTTTIADQGTPGNTVNLAKTPSPKANYLSPAKVPSPPKNRELATGVIETIGGGQQHNNMMQSFAVNFIICTNGLFPSRQ